MTAPEVARGAAAREAPAIVATTLPLAAAIAVFGMIYGAAAAPELGAAMTLATSLLIFSGALQFATLGLLVAGAGPVAILVTAITLSTRHLVLGALLRPRIGGSRLRRAALAFFLVDESFGLAYAAPRRAAATMLVAGLVCYAAWQVGTALGLVGARIEALEGAAVAIFPVLFIGLAAVTSAQPGLALRAAAAGVAVLAVGVVLPDLRTLAPVLAALVVALPGGRDS